ncbi:MAG: hypothetical protein SV108_05045 [Pseudomonadota bacterium]|nr:hypothetical protein [Pseudomonadota bacterium]
MKRVLTTATLTGLCLCSGLVHAELAPMSEQQLAAVEGQGLQGALFAAEVYYDVKQDFWQETTQVLNGVGDFLSDQGNEIAASATDVGESVARTAYLKNLFALNLVQATQEAISNAD